MLQLKWDAHEVLECLGTLPEEAEAGEYENSHTYRISRDGLTILVTIGQYESVLRLALFREATDKPLADLFFAVRGEVLHKWEKWREFLLFQNCVLTPGRFHHFLGKDLFNVETHPESIDIELAVKPDIRMNFV